MRPKGEIYLVSIDRNVCSNINVVDANKSSCLIYTCYMELKWKVHKCEMNMSKSRLDHVDGIFDWLLHFFLVFLFATDYKIQKLKGSYSLMHINISYPLSRLSSSRRGECWPKVSCGPISVLMITNTVMIIMIFYLS